MCGPGTNYSAYDLYRNVGDGCADGDFPTDEKRQGDRRVEMGTGYRSKDGDQYDQDGTGRNGISQKCNGYVTTRKVLRHDPRAHYGGEKQGCAQCFCD